MPCFSAQNNSTSLRTLSFSAVQVRPYIFDCKKLTIQGTLAHLAMCADMEVHRGRDGRLYLLDYSRAFPPQDTKLQPEYVNAVMRNRSHYLG